VLSSISGLIGRRLGASMEGCWEQDDKCPNCRDSLEIAQVKFGFDCISFVSACPNCRLVSISRTTEHDKFRLLLSYVAQAMGAFFLTSKKRGAKLPIARPTSRESRFSDEPNRDKAAIQGRTQPIAGLNSRSLRM
jgi:hypothetical protein